MPQWIQDQLKQPTEGTLTILKGMQSLIDDESQDATVVLIMRAHCINAINGRLKGMTASGSYDETSAKHGIVT